VRRHYERERHAPGSQALQDALAVLEGRAVFEGRKQAVALRVAGDARALYLDLGNEAWDVVHVTGGGWRVGANEAVRFRRTRGMLALPVPARGGSVDELKPFLNVASEDDFALLVSWLLAALRPTGPYPILCLLGEHGCAKSTASRVLRALVDPSSSPLRSLPRDERDLMIAAKNSWCLAFDNLSSLPTWVSDALCRIATGGGFATRELFTDDGEAFFSAQRPVLVNGIEELATRPDLVDRAIVITLPEIASSERRTEGAFWAAFEAARPRIVGALFDALASAMKRVDEVKLERLPRMADFAQWIAAAELGLGWKAGRFLEAYEKNRSEAVLLGIECDPVALAVRELARRGPWSGTAGDLHEALGEIAPDSARRSKEWPKTPKGVTDRLRRLAPSLRAIGVSARAGARSGRGRLWSVDPVPNESEHASEPSARAGRQEIALPEAARERAQKNLQDLEAQG